MISVCVGAFMILLIGILWMAYRYQKEKRSAASFTIVEIKKGMQKTEDEGL